MSLELSGRRRLLPFTVSLAVAAGIVTSCMWGVVEDANTKAGVSGATVKVTDSHGATYTTTTNANGLYSFDQASGAVPAVGPVTVEVSAPGYGTATLPRLVQYDDNAKASLANLSSFWEVQSFSLLPAAPGVSADLAVTDLYPDHQPVGTLWARITNHGPNTLSGANVQLVCSGDRTHWSSCATDNLGNLTVPLSLNIAPGQTLAFNTAIGLDTATYWYGVNCTVQTSFTDANPTNNLYREIIPPPAGDLALEDVFLSGSNDVIFRMAASGSLPVDFWFDVYESYPSGLTVSAGARRNVVMGSSAYWTGFIISDTPTVGVSIDGDDCIPETNEANNKMTKTCSAASHTCW